MFFLSTGYMRLPEVMMKAGGRWAYVSIPLTVGVIQREDGRYVLVDAGLSRHELDKPAEAIGWLRQHAFRMDRRGEPPKCAADQLRDRGIDPADVAAIVPTHLHIDHVGGFADFPNAELIVRADELESSRKRGKNAGFHHVKTIDASGRARPIQLREEDRHGFPGHFDVFGDGRVVLLDARGHTAGSVAVQMTDPSDGMSVLMAGDAAYTRGELTDQRPSLLMRYVGFRRDWVKATWGRLSAFEKAHPECPLVLSHDLERFEQLPH